MRYCARQVKSLHPNLDIVYEVRRATRPEPERGETTLERYLAARQYPELRESLFDVTYRTLQMGAPKCIIGARCPHVSIPTSKSKRL
jgi:hypothetical protein